MAWFAVGLLLAVSFIFSGLEAALLSITRARLRHEAEGHDQRAERLERLYSNRHQLLVIALTVNNACNVFAFGIFALLMIQRLDTHGLWIAFMISLPVYLLLGELIPKLLFRHFPFRMMVLFVGLLEIAYLIFRPFIWLSRNLLVGLGWWKDYQPPSHEEGRQAFRELTATIHREGTLNDAETELIERVLDFEMVQAKDVMLPLRKVTAIPIDMPLQSVVQLARDTNFDQFPVMSASGDLVGLIRVFEVLQAGPETERVGEYVRRLVRTPPDEKAILVLQRLRNAGVEMAAVYNATGRPLGVVSSHDIVQAMMSTGQAR